jgi:hypothetical protein
MALTVDFAGRIVHSDASITDMVAFHLALRDVEDGPDAVIHPIIHTYKAIPLGGGAIFPAVAFVNGWTLQFPAGNWAVKGGNLDCAINPVSGAYVERTQSAAYAVTAIGGSGPTAADIAAAVGARLVEGAYTADQIIRIIASVLSGKVSGAGTGVESFRDILDLKDRARITVDTNGNRTGVVLDAS